MTTTRRRSTAMVLPAVLLVTLVLGAGLVTALASSLGLMPLVGSAELTIDAYTSLGSDLPRSALLTLALAAASTAIAVVVGLAAGLAMVASRRGRRLLVALGAAVVTVPHLVAAAAIGLLLAESGLLPRWLGVEDGAWPALVGGPWWVAVIVEYAWKESAFVALVVAGALSSRVDSFTEAAAVLGAGPAQRFRRVTLPLATPALIASAGIAFVFTVGAYEVAWLLGRAYPEPLSVMAYRLFTDTDLAARPQAMAVAVVTTTLAVVVAGGVLAALRRSPGWR